MNQQIGYDIYVKRCVSYGIKPLNFKQFIGKLSLQQLMLYCQHEQRDNSSL